MTALTRAKFKEKPRIKVTGSFYYTMLSLIAVLMIFPFVYTILSSFKLEEQINQIPPVWIPNPFILNNYQILFKRIDIGRLYLNSFAIATTVTIGSVYLSSLAGYVLAKFNFRGRNFVFWVILASMMIPGPVILVPWYQLCVAFHMINNYAGVIVPCLVWNYGIFLLMQFMHTIPNELLDAGRIDGASELQIYHQIIFPNILPAVSALGIFTFLSMWDQFLWPLIILLDQKLYTLPIGLASFSGQWWTDIGPTLAGSTLAIIPVLIVFLIFQRNITEGVTLTGLK